MFSQPRPKKRTVERPFYRKKRKTPIEEITFNPDEREEYLTGFRKRKLQRVKHAQEVAAKKARESRNEMRKKLREDRRIQFEDHVRAVSQLLKESETAGHEEDQVFEGDMEWDGIEDKPAPGEFEDQEQEYIDDDRFTTVTIESVSVTRDGLEKPSLDEDEDEDERQGRAKENPKSAAASRQEQQAKKPPAPKHKKFRYESKHQRKKTLEKQRGQKSR